MTTQSPRPFLLEDAIDSDPFRQLSLWLDEAKAHGVPEHNAMVIGTVDPDGTPSTRTVLLRGLGPDGLRFFTNRLSRKGRAIAAHENVSALFPWYALERQVKVHGVAIPLDPRDDDAYFASRPWGSRIAARVSAQSQPIASRAELDAAWEAEAARYPEGGEVPRPEHWGGYRIVPREIEFWQGRESRRHDRLAFLRASADADWRLERRQP